MLSALRDTHPAIFSFFIMIAFAHTRSLGTRDQAFFSIPFHFLSRSHVYGAGSGRRLPPNNSNMFFLSYIRFGPSSIDVT